MADDQEIEDAWQRYCDKVRQSPYLIEYIRQCVADDISSQAYEKMVDGRTIGITVHGNADVTLLVCLPDCFDPKENHAKGRKYSRVFPADIIKLIKP